MTSEGQKDDINKEAKIAFAFHKGKNNCLLFTMFTRPKCDIQTWMQTLKEPQKRNCISSALGSKELAIPVPVGQTPTAVQTLGSQKIIE